MAIVVTGAKGQLGWELYQKLGDRALACDHQALDITDREAVQSLLREVRPTAVINCAAYTAVDKAETEPDRCHLVNAVAVGLLAEECQAIDCALVQVSTDYVFGGPASERPHREEDPTCARGVYAQTKLEGETRARLADKHLVVRTCGLYGRAAPGRPPNNFVETMLRLGAERDRLRIVNDQFCTPSFVRHVAEGILFLLQQQAWGTWHVVNAGSTNWYGFAEEIFRQAGIDIQLEPISTAEYGAAAPRPAFSVLDTSKYDRLGGPALPSWQRALEVYLAERG